MSEESFEDVVQTIASLTSTQAEAFSRICVNDDSGIPPRTGDALIRKGLVRPIEQSSREGGLTFKIRRYDVASYAVHMAWCERASRGLEP